MKNLCIALLLVTTSLTFAQKAKPKTTPEHIKLIAEVAKEFKPRESVLV